MNELVSVIIPTYNRCFLIKDTIESVLSQTYENWECIVVDDDSDDATAKIMQEYCFKDNRVKFYFRPSNLPKGANSCRNYGFDYSKGKYIIWFDSDDLMTPDHIAKKIKAIRTSNADFVVARTANFKEDQVFTPYTYEKKSYGIRASDFILLKIHWYTYDVLIKRRIAQQISWNEKMKSWQDYNYFCKMLLVTEKGLYIDEVLTHRRLHSNSIQKSLTRDTKTFQTELLENRILTFQDIHETIHADTKSELIYGMMNLSFDLARICSYPKKMNDRVMKIVRKHFGRKNLFYFQLALFAAYFSKRGNLFLQKAKGK